MIINYLKIALRNLRRYKGHSFINIFGLSVGIAAAILIFLYARNELSYERFHQQADDISIVYKQRQTA
ncbi:MAG: ABC transporter permease, partial [Calditrichaeota bacterium]|nr:ABC transporter permease [Calditrichota bacterium]